MITPMLGFGLTAGAFSIAGLIGLVGWMIEKLHEL